MLETRVLPCLLLSNGGLVKTVRFKNPTYVGDPINAVRIFNDKEVDELVLLDIEASRRGAGPDFPLLSKISREAFMPMGYGGGVRSLEDARRLFSIGFEKVIINACALERPEFIQQASSACGSQSIVASIDVKKNFWGQGRVYDHVRGRPTSLSPRDFAVRLERLGAGEIALNSVDRDGTMSGYDLDLVRAVCQAVRIPVIAMGGAGRLEDFRDAVRFGGASAVAAGSFFVFHGRHRAVLITYPDKSELKKTLASGGGDQEPGQAGRA
ncbi:MAG: imidazole glycerol phosphate synthase subunit HisF [Elusimicrobia bacterium]|nr:imidazole glycerol phosphate synthase subunit HisF [Elusimicrobiota bacterium]